MTTSTYAPELLVQTWFNTDRPLLLSGLHAFGAVDDLRIGAEIGALTQESDTAALAQSSAA
jgi:hypothetical protein